MTIVLADADEQALARAQWSAKALFPNTAFLLGRAFKYCMTVLENIVVARHMRIQYVSKRFPHLEDHTWQLAGPLSGSEQQMMAADRAMMA